jgi:hypothetical protein
MAVQQNFVCRALHEDETKLLLRSLALEFSRWSSVSLVVTVSGLFRTIEEASPLFWFSLLIPAITVMAACLFMLRFSRNV